MRTSNGKPKNKSIFDSFIIYFFIYTLKIINALNFNNYRINE